MSSSAQDPVAPRPRVPAEMDADPSPERMAQLLAAAAALPVAVQEDLASPSPPPPVAAAEASGRPWCFFVPERVPPVTAVVVAGHAGYQLMVPPMVPRPWCWGDDLATAREVAATVNATRGLTEEQVAEILASAGLGR